tara:strand:+ start:425 stop:685 length:261 start_codon:yes stop_codon:yes gene_type:complete
VNKVAELRYPVDQGSRNVRVMRWDDRGNVEFQFSIGDPSLYLDMVLPLEAFDEFCRENRVRILSKNESAWVDVYDLRWRFGDEKQE